MRKYYLKVLYKSGSSSSYEDTVIADRHYINDGCHIFELLDEKNKYVLLQVYPTNSTIIYKIADI